MATREEKQAYVDGMARERGYVLDFHKVMAEHDFDALQATNNLVEAAYLKERRLDRKTKELIFIVSLTVMRASKGHIASHIRVALDLGLSKEGLHCADRLLPWQEVETITSQRFLNIRQKDTGRWSWWSRWRGPG